MKRQIIRGVMVGMTSAAGILAVVGPAAAATPTGDGTQARPFMTSCDDSTLPGAATCAVTFPARTMKPLDSENLDFYRCPLDHPYLENRNYAPWGKDIAPGIEIRGMGLAAIDARVSPIMNPVTGGMNPVTGGWVVTGNNRGEVTNWSVFTRDYGVTLHCTNDLKQGYGRL